MKYSASNYIQYFNILLLVLLFVSCNNKKENTAITEQKSNLEGVWEQTNFFRLADNDTILKDNSKIQHKIYLDGYLIWNSNAGTDSLEWHGYGTYTFKNDTLVETLTSMSIPLRGYHSIYPIIIETKDDVLKQIIHYKENDVNYQNIELYKKLN